MKKRMVIKPGDIFCAEIDNEFKCYAQYVCKDKSDLVLGVLVIYKKHYPLDYQPSFEEIVSDEPSFYVHADMKRGVDLGLWERIGRYKENLMEDYSWLVFGDIDLDNLDNWWIWHVNCESVNVGKLPREYWDSLQIGGVYPVAWIVERMKRGYYINTDPVYSVVKRKPYPDFLSYVHFKRGIEDIYYEFLGENAVRQIVVEKGNIIRLTSENPSCSGKRLRKSSFSDTNWDYDEFITKTEFEKVWNDKQTS